MITASGMRWLRCCDVKWLILAMAKPRRATEGVDGRLRRFRRS